MSKATINKYIIPYIEAKIAAIKAGKIPYQDLESIIEEASDAYGVKAFDIKRSLKASNTKSKATASLSRNALPLAMAGAGIGLAGYGGHKEYNKLMNPPPKVSGVTSLFNTAEVDPGAFEKFALPFNMISRFGPMGAYGNKHPRMTNVGGVLTPIRDEKGKVIRGPLVDNRGNILDPAGFLTALHVEGSNRRLFAFELGLESLGITQEYLDDLYYNKPFDLQWDNRRSPEDNLRLMQRQIMDTSYHVGRGTPSAEADVPWYKRTLINTLERPENIPSAMYTAEAIGYIPKAIKKAIGKFRGKVPASTSIVEGASKGKALRDSVFSLYYYSQLFKPARAYSNYLRDANRLKYFSDNEMNPEDVAFAHKGMEDPYTAYRKGVFGLDPDQDILDKYKNPLAAAAVMAGLTSTGGIVKGADPVLSPLWNVGRRVTGHGEKVGIPGQIIGYGLDALSFGWGRRILSGAGIKGIDPAVSRYGRLGSLGPLAVAGVGAAAIEELGRTINHTNRIHAAADYKNKHGWKGQHAAALQRKARTGRGATNVRELILQHAVRSPRQMSDVNNWILKTYGNELDMPYAKAVRNYMDHRDAVAQRKKDTKAIRPPEQFKPEPKIDIEPEIKKQ